MTKAGECINEVTFYRNDRTYDFNGAYVDYGIEAMAYKTSKGTVGTIGKYGTTYTPAQYEASYSKRTYTLPT